MNSIDTTRVRKLLEHIEVEIKEMRGNQNNKEFEDIFFITGMSEAIQGIWLEIERIEEKNNKEKLK